MYFICSIIALFVVFVFHYRTRYSKAGKLIDKLSGPKPLPIIGNILNLLHCEDPLMLFAKMNKQYYPTWRVWIANQAFVNLRSPDDIKKLLSSPKHLEKAMLFYRLFKDWLNDNLLLSNGKKWQYRRRLIMPAFNSNKMDKYAVIAVEHGAHLVDALKAEKNAVVVERVLGKFVLNTICEIALGSPVKHLDDREIERFLEAMTCYGETVIYRIMRPWYYLNWVFRNFTHKGWKHKKNVRILHNFSSSIIKARKDYHIQTEGKYLKEFSSMQNVGNGENDDVPLTIGKEIAAIDLFFAASNDGMMDASGIQEETDGTILAGFETVITSLTFAVQLLAEYTDIQTKARKEVDEMFESCNGKVTLAELNQLPYLHRCIQESMRLYPAIPFIGRQLREDLHLENQIIPSGCVVSVSVYDLHRDPRLWPEPNKFDPDRWLPERSLDRHPFSYLPFSGGPRNCPGQKAGLLEMKVYCAFMLHNFYLEAMELHENFILKGNISLKTTKEIKVKFIPIDKLNSN